MLTADDDRVADTMAPSLSPMVSTFNPLGCLHRGGLGFQVSSGRDSSETLCETLLPCAHADSGYAVVVVVASAAAPEGRPIIGADGNQPLLGAKRRGNSDFPSWPASLVWRSGVGKNWVFTPVCTLWISGGNARAAVIVVVGFLQSIGNEEILSWPSSLFGRFRVLVKAPFGTNCGVGSKEAVIPQCGI